jgi:hypothetical protein
MSWQSTRVSRYVNAVQPTEILAQFPERIRAGTEQPGVLYLKQPGCAVHNRPPGAPAPGAVLVLNNGQIAVYRELPPHVELRNPSRDLTPVYAQSPRGTPVIPTGLVLIRFREDLSVLTRRPHLEQAGYEIVQTLPYAPRAAWLRARSGNPADALRRLAELEQLDGVENVEPQMLMEAARRSGSDVAP